MPNLVTAQEFSDSAYGSLEDQIDTPIPQLLDAAEAHLEMKMRRKIKAATYVETLYADTNTIFLKQRPIISITSVERSIFPQGPIWYSLPLDRLFMNSEAGYFDPAYAVAGAYVRVTYTAGFTVIPPDIKQAVIIQTALIASPDYELLGVGDGEEPGIGHLQEMVDRLIEPYKLTGII